MAIASPALTTASNSGPAAALALHLAFYNFCRVHGSLRVTPAMESRLTDHVWDLAELLSA